jgi:hypothetical protein
VRKTELRGTTSARLTGKTRAQKKTKAKYDPAEKPARRVVRERSGGLCEVQIPGICEGRATNYQHRVNRSQLGGYAPSAALDACGSGTTGCHGRITGNPEEAYRNGWSVRSWDNPLTCPVLYRGEWVLLDDAGGLTPSLPFEEGAA